MRGGGETQDRKRKWKERKRRGEKPRDGGRERDVEKVREMEKEKDGRKKWETFARGTDVFCWAFIRSVKKKEKKKEVCVWPLFIYSYY